jgi:transcriptional regulator with XRE-family HTH domain
MVPAEPFGSAPRDAAEGAELAALLKKFRVQAGLSQQALAERALISVQAVSALERGYRKAPYQATLERIADALALSEDARQALKHSAHRSRGPRLDDEGQRPAHNLPRQLTSFLGRDEVVQEIAELVETSPLVSVVGTGGAGKTRAAVEVGMRLLKRFPHGVWFVELAPLSDPALVPHALAGALRVQESPRRSLLETLFAYLAQKRLLVIFDNCEHVISQARVVAGSLLRECPNVALLATSRESLNLTGERTYRIPTLAIPKQTLTSPDEAVKYGAVALFVERVRAADSRFEVMAGQGNRVSVPDPAWPVGRAVRLCRRCRGSSILW